MSCNAALGYARGAGRRSGWKGGLMSADHGINFPQVEGEGRSSTATGKAVLAASVADVDPDLARRISAAKNWRLEYPKLFEEVVRVEARSARTALDVARSGLAAASSRFVDVDADGDHPLRHCLQTPGDLRTVSVSGKDTPVRELTVPYQDDVLRGAALLRQLDAWVARGIAEPSFAEAVAAVVRNPDWLDLRERTFTLVGAGAQMGPYRRLITWGATVAAVDRPRRAKWERMLRNARDGAGTVLVPVPDTADPGRLDDEGYLAEIAGADITTQVGPILRWLEGMSGPMTVGNYGYADSAGFVRLSVAFDVLLEELTARRQDLSVSYLATPADVFLVPVRAVDMAERRRHGTSRLAAVGRAVNQLTLGRYFRPNYLPEQLIETDAYRYGVVNAFILEQGQNYALAKRLQRWRMVLTRDAGILTSVHVAPPARTLSVLKNPLMSERQAINAYLGIESFDPPTVDALAAAILVHDLHNPASPANPAVPLAHPHEAFMFAANPGGRWRVPFELNSCIPLLSEMSWMQVQTQHAGRGLVGLSRSAVLRMLRRGQPGPAGNVAQDPVERHSDQSPAEAGG